jgi:nucleotide-binding universal stress UspA family protein
MFARILAATDFSAPSEAALVQARHLAASTGATLHVIHVVDNMFLRAVLADPRDYDTAALRQLRDQMPAGEEVPTVLAVERSDEPADEITSYARIHDIDLIVMGTHGRGRVAHLLLGSVAEKVARTAPCPVLTLREAPVAPGEDGLRLLVPTDFSPASDAALGCAKRLAARIGASIHLVHVVAPPAIPSSFGSEVYVPDPAAIQEEYIANAKTQLARRILVDARSRVKATSEVICNANPAGTIMAYAASNRFDLIVMGTHGRGGIARLLMGSVAESVIRTAACPVLTVKAALPVTRVRDGNARPYAAAG